MDVLNRFVILIPLNDNNKKTIEMARINPFLEQLYALLGGYTLAQNNTGYFDNKGEKQEDRSLTVWANIYKAEYFSKIMALHKIVQEMAVAFEQFWMYFEDTKSEVYFVEKPQNQSEGEEQ